MATEQVAVQELPFTIEPLSPKRVQTRSRFAGRAETEADMWIVRTVYYAFWFEMRVHTTFGHVVQWSQSIHEQSDANFLLTSDTWLCLVCSMRCISTACHCVMPGVSLFLSIFCKQVPHPLFQQ